MNEGWISLHRFLLKKPIWKTSTPEQKTVLIAILLMVDHSSNEWEWKGKPFKTKPGEMITSYNSIIKKSGKGISLQNVRSSLKRFKKYEFLTYEPTHRGLHISITNWETYQNPKNEPNRPTNTPVTDHQQTGNRPVTPNNNVNNENNDNNVNKKQTEKDFLLEYLNSKIIETGNMEISDKIIEFYYFRMAMPKAKRYKSEKGINGLFRDMNNCDLGALDVSECLEICMEKPWLTPDPKYFGIKPKQKGMKKSGFTKGYYKTTKKKEPRKSYSELLKTR